MSTAANPLNGAVGVTEEDFYAHLREQAQRILTEEKRALDAAEQARTGRTPVAAPVEEPEPIKLNVFGQERTFKDTSEISGAVERLVQEHQAAMQAAQEALKPKPEEKHEEYKVDLDEFVNRIQKDPTDSIDYAIKAKYGVGLEYLLGQAKRTEEIEGALVAIQFKEMNEDYSPTPKNTQILNGIRGSLNLPFTVQGLSAAYAVGKQYGYFQPQQQPQIQQRPSPPPSINVNRMSAVPSQSEDILEMVDQMSPDKAVEFVNRMLQSTR